MGALSNRLPLPFSRIGAYEIDRLLGRGQVTGVYAGRHSSEGRLVALKVLHPHLTNAPTARARFFREVRALSRVRHPNVVEVLDFGEDGIPYFTMPLVEGEDLKNYMRRVRPMSVTQIADCLLPVIEAVAVAHDAGVIHRDLKPSNIRLPRDGLGRLMPKLIDFGISKFAGQEHETELTETGLTLGTPSHMAPEQVRSAKHADARSDIYALGVILYECATGVRPFHGDSSYDLMHAILTAAVAPPSFHRACITEVFDEIVLRALARNPCDRFRSARELGRALVPFASRPPPRSPTALTLVDTSQQRGWRKEGCLRIKEANEHGGFDVSIDVSIDNAAHLIPARIWGEWDPPVAANFCRAILDLGRTRAGGSWSLVVDAKGFQVQSPEVSRLRQEAMSELRRLGCDKIAAVSSHVLYAMQFKRIASESHVAGEVFDDEESALDWVREIRA